MAVVRIEYVPVQSFGLGYFGFDHLQLVYQPDDANPASRQDYWFVIEGVRDNAANGSGPTLGVVGFDGITSLAFANNASGAALVSAIGTPDTRGSRVLPYASASGAWGTLAFYAQQFQAQHFPYFAFSTSFSISPTVNSTSVIASLLFYTGLDISANWPGGVRFSPGYTTLLGTLAGDNLSTQGTIFDTILGGAGDDTLHGSDDNRVDKLYGGVGNDVFYWSQGKNIIHGGQPGLDYALDGIDTIDYAGAGIITISGNPDAVENQSADYFVSFVGGSDQLFSIEKLRLDPATDRVIIEDGASLIQDGLVVDFGKSASAAPGDGNTLDFSARTDSLLINASTATELQVTNPGATDEKGLMIEQANTILASSGGDTIYADSGIRRIAGGAGNDVIDARAVEAFSGRSAQGYDVEITTGGGSDTIIANTGRTLITRTPAGGGNRFVLPSVTSGSRTTELDITGATAADRLYLPYNLFSGSGGGFDGSTLFPILGGIGSYADMKLGVTSVFEWRPESVFINRTDYQHGAISFTGNILFKLSGADLVIDIQTGTAEVVTILLDNVGHTATYLDVSSNPLTDAVIRVHNYHQGDLGLNFFDIGAAEFIKVNGFDFGHYPGWDSAVAALTAADAFVAPLAARPQPLPEPPGVSGLPPASPQIVNIGPGDQAVSLASASVVYTGTGNDTINGSAGNDTYYVNNGADVINEAANQGTDTVKASVDYALAANIENLTLTGSAVNGTGNSLANRLVGSDGANVFSGGAGNDTLLGGLGNDTLDGGSGSNLFVYRMGDGNDTVIDTATGSDVNTLGLNNIATSDVTFARAANGRDLVLGLPESGSVTLKDYFVSAGAGVQVVTFDDRTRWLAADIAVRANAAPVAGLPPPVAVDDPYILFRGTSAVLRAQVLLANDHDPSGYALSIASVQGAIAGSVSLNAAGDVVVNAGAGFTGDDSFTYTIDNGHGGRATARVDVQFLPHRLPVVSGTASDASLTAGKAFSFTLPPALFTDPDGLPLSLSVGLAGGGAVPAWLRFDASTGTFAGTAPAGSPQTLGLTVTASDGSSSVSTGFNLAVRPATPSGQLVLGTPGRDVLGGGAGNDYVYGDAGNDTLFTSAGNDTLDGGTGINTADYSKAPGGVSAALTATGGTVRKGVTGASFNRGPLNVAIAAIDTLIGINNIVGSNLDDLLVGNAGDNVFTPGGGNDQISGNGGNDTVDFSTVTSGLIVNLAAGFAQSIVSSGLPPSATAAIVGLDRIQGIANVTCTARNDIITGNAGNNTLVGGGGNDVLSGGDGNDRISGGAGTDTIAGGNGSDTLTGGGGSNRYYYDGSESGFDTITDFSSVLDSFSLASGRGFGAYTAGAHVALTLGTGGPAAIFASIAAQGFGYDTVSGALYYNAGGAAGVKEIAVLQSAPTLSAANFTVV